MEKNRETKKNKKNKAKSIYTENDIFFARIIGLLLLLKPSMYFIKQFNILYLDVFLSSILILVILCVKRKHFQHNLKPDIIFIYIFFAIASIWSGFYYSSYLINWVGMIYILLFSTLPWYIIGRYTVNYNCVLWYLKKYALAVTFVCTSIYIHKMFNGKLRIDDMALSYGFLPATIISLYVFFTHKKPLHLLNVIYSLFVIITNGSRGPVLCIVVFILLFLIFNIKKNRLLVICLTTLFIILYANSQKALVWFLTTLSKYGFTSRTLIKLQEGTILSGTGREAIQKVTFDLISNNPITGVGIGVDRIIIFSEIYIARGMHDKLSTSYPHNLFIELLAQYGVIVGGIFILLILLILIMSLLRGNESERNMIIIFIGIGFVPLMVSSSYLLSQYFFYLLGLAVNIVFKENRAKIELNVG